MGQHGAERHHSRGVQRQQERYQPNWRNPKHVHIDDVGNDDECGAFNNTNNRPQAVGYAGPYTYRCFMPVVGIISSTGNANVASSTGAVQFNANNQLGGDTTNFFWDNTNKRLGIGVGGASAKLDISGTASGYSQIWRNSGVAGDPSLSLWMTNNGAAPGKRVSFLTNNAAFEIFDQDAAATRLFINDSNGNVGLGMFSPAYALDVSGTVRATAYLYTSDAKLKKDVVSTPGLSIIEKLRGVSFVWKGNGKKATGVIAQEVEAVLPNAVSTDSTGVKSVDYPQLIGPLIESVKELKAANDKLASDNKAMREEIDALKRAVGNGR